MAIKLSEKGEQVVYKTRRLVEGVKCDACGKFIKASNDYWDRDATKYYEVTTGHRDWGNDSCESIKRQDICPDCIRNFVGEYLLTESLTAYIEIETTYSYPEARWED
jgi:hypothetical protein